MAYTSTDIMVLISNSYSINISITINNITRHKYTKRK